MSQIKSAAIMKIDELSRTFLDRQGKRLPPFKLRIDGEEYKQAHTVESR